MSYQTYFGSFKRAYIHCIWNILYVSGVLSAEVHTIQLQLSVVQFLQHFGRCKITTIHVLRHF